MSTNAETKPETKPSVLTAYRDICFKTQTALREMKDCWWKNKVVEVQRYADRHETKEFYASLKDIYEPKHTPSFPLISADGSTVITEKSRF